MWKTREGKYVDVKDMGDSHVRNSLSLIVKRHTLDLINYGARYCSQINVDKMTTEECGEMLSHACKDPKWFKLLIAEQCFGPTEFKNVMKELEEWESESESKMNSMLNNSTPGH
jgi:hypothetical protein